MSQIKLHRYVDISDYSRKSSWHIRINLVNIQLLLYSLYADLLILRCVITWNHLCINGKSTQCVNKYFVPMIAYITMLCSGDILCLNVNVSRLIHCMTETVCPKTSRMEKGKHGIKSPDLHWQHYWQRNNL